MRLSLILAVLTLSLCTRAAEEKIRGLLEKTNKAGACAQITDALSEIYYINKSDESEKAIEKFVGKNEKVVITGTVESKEGDPAYFFALKSVEPYAPKLPPAPPPPPPPLTPPAASTPPAAQPAPASPAPAEAKPDAKPVETKPAAK